MVSAGGDSFAQIGSSKGGDAEAAEGESSVALVDGWKAMCAECFPSRLSDAETVVNLEELQLLPEPTLDVAVHSKESLHHLTSICSISPVRCQV